MSAMIIPFPGNSEGRLQKQEGSIQALIAIEQMQDYRILGIETMRRLSTGQLELLRLVRSYASGGEPPKMAELEALLRQFGGALRHIDFADKFLVVHGQPVNEAERYEQLRHQYLPQISHRPLLFSVLDDCT